MFKKAKKETIVIDLGGSIVFPNLEGFNLPYLKKLKQFLLKQSNNYRFILVIGGGKVCRFYQDEAKKVGIKSNDSLDWIGIKTTELNAEFLKHFFNISSEVITGPRQKASKEANILISSGWYPGNSTDFIAFKLALIHGTKRVIIATNVPYIYDKDVNKDKTAKKIEKLSWKEYFSLIKGKSWQAGMSLPIDPKAANLGEKEKLEVFLLEGNNLANLKKAINSESFKGTVIKDYQKD